MLLSSGVQHCFRNEVHCLVCIHQISLLLIRLCWVKRTIQMDGVQRQVPLSSLWFLVSFLSPSVLPTRGRSPCFERHYLPGATKSHLIRSRGEHGNSVPGSVEQHLSFSSKFRSLLLMRRATRTSALAFNFGCRQKSTCSASHRQRQLFRHVQWILTRPLWFHTECRTVHCKRLAFLLPCE